MLLAAECAYYADARKIFSREPRHAVESALHLAEKRDAHEHYRKYDDEKHGDGYGENDAAFHIYDESRYHRADDDKGTAQEQTKPEIESVLNLIYIASEPCYYRVRAERVKLGEGKALHMVKGRLTKRCGKAYARFCRKELCRNGTAKPERRHAEQNQRTTHHIGFVAVFHADIYHIGDNYRHKQIEGNLQHLEKRREDALLPVLFQIDKQFFHLLVFLRFLRDFYIFNSRNRQYGFLPREMIF